MLRLTSYLYLLCDVGLVEGFTLPIPRRPATVTLVPRRPTPASQRHLLADALTSHTRTTTITVSRTASSTRTELHCVSTATIAAAAAKDGFTLISSCKGTTLMTFPLVLWGALLVFSWCKRGFQSFGTWMAVHDFHAYALLVLSALSLYYGDNAIFSEAIPTFFTMSYFVVDMIDCILRRDAIFILHSLLALGICGGCFSSPLHHNTLRTVSKGAWVELSTPALHRWYATQTKRDYHIYFVLFTICRIFWIPYLLSQVIRHYSSHTVHTILSVLGAFLYALQLGWYANMIRTLRRYDDQGYRSNNTKMTTEAQIDLIFGPPTKKNATDSSNGAEHPDD